MKVILDKKFKGWILGGIIRESSQFSQVEIDIQYLNLGKKRAFFAYMFRRYLYRLRVSKGDLIVNQNTLLYLVENNLLNSNQLNSLRCLFTHASEETLKQGNLIHVLSDLEKVLVQNESDRLLLIAHGIPTQKISVVYGGIDRDRYFPSMQQPVDEFVLITGDAKLRKNPSKVVEIIATFSEINFVICGRHWKKYLESKGVNFANLKVHDYEPELNEKLMRMASVFITVSNQEGGPYPVLEALASGTPVISTPVGWSPELIHNENGRLIDFNTEIEVIGEAIFDCIQLKRRLFSEDLLLGRFTWQEFARLLYED